MMTAYDIVIRPIITERAMAGAADKKYVFEVAKSAGKVEIKNTMADGARVFAPWAMFVLLVLAAFTSFAAIFLFKRRMFQVRLSVFSSLILVGYYIVFGVFVYVFKSRYDADFTLSWTAAFPAVGLILDYLAFRNIMKDELIVRSLDRLR